MKPSTSDFVAIKGRITEGINILPAEPGFCSAKCFHALICGRVKGAIVIPQVPDYPESKLEVISSKSIRDVLSLEVGDLVTVEIYYYDKGKNGLSKKDRSREETQLH